MLFFRPIKIYTIIALLLALLAMAGCNVPRIATPTQAPAQPAVEKVEASAAAIETPTAEATMTPGPARIGPENAAQLKVAANAELENAYWLRWSRDNAQLGALTPGGMKLMDAQTLTPLANVEVKSPFVVLDYSADQKWMAATSDQQTVEIRDILTGQVKQTIKPEQPILSAAFNSDGSQIALSSGGDIAVTLWDAQSGQSLRTWRGFDTAAPVYRAEIAPNDRTLIWIARATLQLMDLATGSFGPRLEHEDFIAALSARPDMRFIATTSAGTINGNFGAVVKVWDLASGTPTATLPAGESVPPTIAYSPDGNILATSQGVKVVIWDPARQEQIAVLDGPTAPVNAVAFSPDGTTLAAASQDGQIRLWRVKP